MGDAKHTPGPWEVFGDHGTSIGQPGEDGTLVAEAVGTGSKEKNRANARLMAAAPDLLGTCRTAREALSNLEKWADFETADSLRSMIDMLDAAIAKATGTQVTSTLDSYHAHPTRHPNPFRED